MDLAMVTIELHLQKQVAALLCLKSVGCSLPVLALESEMKKFTLFDYFQVMPGNYAFIHSCIPSTNIY